jgi:hypothetical protein
MKKKSTSASAFLSLRVLIGLFIGLAGILVAVVGVGTFSNVSAQSNLDPDGQAAGQMKVIPAVHSDLSPPLRDQPVIWPQAGEEREPTVPLRIPIEHKDAPDPVIQNSFWQPLKTLPAIPSPIRQWAGMSKPCVGCSVGIPPDPNGAVGKAQYVEMVNVGLQVFDKLTGTSLLGPIPINSVWSGFGGTCQTANNGDPIVVYDRLADRWIISQFATPSGVPNPQVECIAVSRTGDATGEWYRYDFHVTTEFQDYPKFGVWPDGYYMSANLFEFGHYVGPQPFVFDREKMLVGDPTATFQTPGVIRSNNILRTEKSFLPSDLDGILPPQPGAANHFVSFPQPDEIPPGSLIYKVWAFHVDWDHPRNSWFRLQASVPAAGFTELCPGNGVCVPQLGVTEPLDSLSGRLMFRNAYRRFPDGHESLLNNFSVSANSVAGIRWFELQRAPQGNWMLRQQSTYQPDSTWRWMGSIASDNQGNIALGFSASSATIHPQIRYAGRLATDPLNVLSGEQHLFDGTGSQTNDGWGDYSDMTIDPVDDCTFYYTNEYYATTSSRDWQTRIGYFRFGQCTPPQKGTVRFIVCDRGAPLKTVVSIDGITYGATLADGSYDAVLPPGSHGYAITNPAFGTKTGRFTVTNGQTTLVEVCLGGRAAVGDFNGDGHPDYVLRDTNTRQTEIWYLNNNLFIGSALGPTLPPSWGLSGVADFNLDSHPDYALFAPSNHRTVIWYLNNNVLVNALYGPTLPDGWQLVATAGDFNGDSHPDYLLYNMNNLRTAIWYLNNNVLINALYGPTLPAGWALTAVADFDGNGHPDYLLYNINNGRTAIWYLDNNVLINTLYGPTVPVGWAAVAAADFDGDGYPDYLLYNASTRRTAIWYLNNNIFVNAAYAPTLSDAWTLIAP